MTKTLMWDITNNCNLQCKHCYNNDLFKNQENELSVDLIKSTINKLPAKSHIHILGGEPLIRKDIFEIFKYISLKNLTYSFVTNGLLLDKNKITEICKSKITEIIFSLDGASKYTHEYIRGKKTFNKLIENIKLFTEIKKDIKPKIKIIINCTIYNMNYKEIKDYYKLFQILNIDGVVFNRVMSEGKAEGGYLNIIDKDWIDTCENIAYLSHINHNFNTILYAKPLTLSYLNVKYGTDFNLKTSQCGVYNGKHLMYIRHDGIIYPCNKWYKINEIYPDNKNVSIKKISKKQIKNYYSNNFLYKDIISKYNLNKRSCEICRYDSICYGCILDYYEKGFWKTSIGVCQEVNNRLEVTKENLLKYNNYKINKHYEVLSNNKEVVLKHKKTNKILILKKDLPKIFNSIYKFNEISIDDFVSTSLLKECLLELKLLKIIE